MAYTEYDDKRISLGMAFKAAVEFTVQDRALNPDLGQDTVKIIEARTRAFFEKLEEIAAELGERPKQKSGGGGYRGGGGGSRGPSTRSTLPKVDIDYFEDGKPITFYDQRPAKADGKYNAKAPDFQSVDEFDLRGTGEKKQIPIWINDSDGVPQDDVLDMLVANNVPGLPGVEVTEPVGAAWASTAVF